MSFLNKILSARTKKPPESGGKQGNEGMPKAPLVDESENRLFKGKIITGVLRAARVTEKASWLAEKKKFVFMVAAKATKPEIRKAVEAKYGVGVGSVNVASTPGKERRRGAQIGWRPGFKKAVVTLKEGDIEIQ